MPGHPSPITSSWHLKVSQASSDPAHHDRISNPPCFHTELQHKPLLVDLTVEEGTRLKVLYGSSNGFHAVDLDSAR